MKFQFQVRTGDFEYIMQEGEFLGPDEAVAAFRILKATSQPQAGLAAKEWNHCVDTYMKTGTLNGGTELYSQMSPQQQWFFQEVKKHNKRANYKVDETNE